MLSKTSHRRRSGERGQVLVLALAFIAAFALLVGAVLSFGGVTGLQHMHTEATAAKDGLAEGGAAYAAADAVRPDIPLACAAGSTGQLTMQSGDVAKYTVQDCNPGNSNVGTGSSTGHCLLCILNETPIPPATSVSPSTSVLNSPSGITTTGGDDYINGSIASGSSLTANPASAHVRMVTGATAPALCCTPSTILRYPIPFKDPLASLGAPSPGATKPLGCPISSYSATAGCSETFKTAGAYTINPGLWASLTLTGGGSSGVILTANPGVYVFTGQLQVQGNKKDQFIANNVTIYLACPNYGPTGPTDPTGNACPTSGTGGGISLSGNANVTLTAPGSPQYTNVGGVNGTLLGANVALLADPNLVDPGGVGGCVGLGTGCLYSVSGNGGSITGSVDTRGGGMGIGGNGGVQMTSGLLITNSLWASGSGAGGLSLSGPGTFAGPNSCGVFEDNVTGQLNGSASTSPGHAVIQSDCGNAGANGVVDFNYGP
jgi:hypothetical protein